MSRLHPAIALDDFSVGEDRPRKRKRTRRERRLAELRRQEAEARAEREHLEARRRPRERDLEPLTGALPIDPDPWGPAARMGKNLRVQAAVGHRAAVIELKPGLYLVAELPETALRPEFGFVPLLAPMIVKAAAKTIGPIVDAIERGKAARGDHGARQIAARPDGAGQPAPLALPGPVAAPSAGAPSLGWADDALVADVMDCDACDRRGGR